MLVRDESTVESGTVAGWTSSSGSIDVVTGDVLDEMSVERAIRGADAVLHAASVYRSTAGRARHAGTQRARTELVLVPHAASAPARSSTCPRSGRCSRPR